MKPDKIDLWAIAGKIYIGLHRLDSEYRSKNGIFVLMKSAQSSSMLKFGLNLHDSAPT